MLAQALPQPIVRSPLRPMNPLRDLGQVADLIEGAFGAELRLLGDEYIVAMRRWAARAPLLLLMDPEESFLSGYVWEEAGHLVGNVTVGPLYRGSAEWLISNVVVHPDYRRRGIGRQLMEAALALIAARGGESAVLQVREDNAGAGRRYASLGFRHLYCSIDLLREAEPAPSPSGPLAAPWRRFRSGDLHAARRLLQRVTPPAQQPYAPILAASSQFLEHGVWGAWLEDRLDGARTGRWVAEEEGRICAFLGARASLRRGRHHRLYWIVRPDQQGRLEEDMVKRGLAFLAAFPDHPTLALAPVSDETGLAALRRCGFREVRRLSHLKLEVKTA